MNDVHIFWSNSQHVVRSALVHVMNKNVMWPTCFKIADIPPSKVGSKRNIMNRIKDNPNNAKNILPLPELKINYNFGDVKLDVDNS